MKYRYNKLDIQPYIDSLYNDGLQKSKLLEDSKIKESISNIGVFKFKGYVKAFRDKLSNSSIDDVLSLYYFDRNLSIQMFKLVSDIEIKLKSYFIEVVYGLTKNPFFYLLKNNYKNNFSLAKDSLYSWEVQEPTKSKELYSHYRDYYLIKYDYEDNFSEYLKDSELINLDEKKNINYPPFHYLIEGATLGTVINLLSKLQIDDNDILKLVGRKFGILKPEVFISYLLRVKELRNRTAHNGRIFNRNYRSVKAIGKYKTIRKLLYDHRLLDVYHTLYFLLGKEFESYCELENKFIRENFKNENREIEDLIMNCMRKR